jgi:signal transduction histidine kinase/CheY-like chemotaxis protein
MVVEKGVAVGHDDCRVELEHLHQSLLPNLLLMATIFGWLWFGVTLAAQWDLANVTPTFGLFAMTALAYRVRQRCYRAACWLFILGLIVHLATIVAINPYSSALAFGVLVIVAANALLGAREAFAATVLTWLAGSAAQHVSLGAASQTYAGTGDTLVLYALTLGVSWLATRPLQQSVAIALTAWATSRQTLDEVRRRRGELYRALRALEEATCRIEHMNNALVVAQRQAEEARALKARFAATVSHEIRGPLNLILGFSRMMVLFPERYEEPLPDAYREDVDTIYRNSQHLLALVDDVLDLSQIEAHRLPLVKDRIDLEEDVVKKVLNTMQSLAERKGLFLRQELAGSLPWVLADSVRLRQALLNLVTNAIRVTERGGITVRTALQVGHILVEVRDTGPGIPPEEMPKLFKEFHQVQVSEDSTGTGSGLGLSICKHLIELHGGEIWAESKVGAGTTFCFTVPLLDAASGAAELLKTDSAPSVSTRQNCLIVHDDPYVVRTLGRHLEGYHVVGVLDHEETASLAETLRPRAIVTSQELAGRIIDQVAGQSTDASIIISCALPRMTERHGTDGLLAFLAKPVSPEMATAVMRKVERNGETTLLLVDDEPDAVRLLEAMLTTMPRPYKILKAYDGLDAITIMQDTVPDIVFVDWVMPGMDGQQLIARMRTDERLRAVPAVVVSARDWVDDQVLLGTQVTVRLHKPMTVAKAGRCFSAVLEALSPGYSPAPTHSQQP